MCESKNCFPNGDYSTTADENLSDVNQAQMFTDEVIPSYYILKSVKCQKTNASKFPKEPKAMYLYCFSNHYIREAGTNQ